MQRLQTLCWGALLVMGCVVTSADDGTQDPGTSAGTDADTEDATAGSATSTAAEDTTTNGDDDGERPGESSSGQEGTDPSGLPPGADVEEPFPIDMGDAPDTPGSYKELPLRLVDNGAPEVTAVDGVIGVVCIGMSNATQECSDYIDKLESGVLGDVNPQVRVVDCAVGGHAIEKWADPAFDPMLWSRCLDRLAMQGLEPGQVRVLYHKAANQFTAVPGDMMTALPPYPDPDSDYFNFIENLGLFAARVPQMLPGVQAVYTSSRSYGGFAGQAARGEPLSYEEGHALNAWLADNAAVDGVWHGWGPYLWAPDCDDGTSNGSGVCYLREDYQGDGVHPAQGARDKISAMIHARLLQHSWYAP